MAGSQVLAQLPPAREPQLGWGNLRVAPGGMLLLGNMS